MVCVVDIIYKMIIRDLRIDFNFSNYRRSEVVWIVSHSGANLVASSEKFHKVILCILFAHRCEDELKEENIFKEQNDIHSD